VSGAQTATLGIWVRVVWQGQVPGAALRVMGVCIFSWVDTLESIQQASQVDMLVGDIYGERDYSSIGLSATTIASSFGKARRRSRLLLWHLSLAVTAP